MSSSEVLGENCQESNCTTNRINLGYIPNTKYNGHYIVMNTNHWKDYDPKKLNLC